MLQHKNRPKDLDTIADADFLQMFRWLNNFALPLIGFSHIIRQPEEGAFLVFHKRRAIVHIVNDFMQPGEGRVVPDQ
ncbi:hypothetical protein EQW76_26985 [Rhizobium sp. rho-13.1]|nr:hypothetical protein EQW76_26985 [Rhizobium sp. rho-13.1]TQY07045.1 hypothetical protein EQW74_25370 [Rhizobium sp. rho-1.1]